MFILYWLDRFFDPMVICSGNLHDCTAKLLNFENRTGLVIVPADDNPFAI